MHYSQLGHSCQGNAIGNGQAQHHGFVFQYLWDPLGGKHNEGIATLQSQWQGIFCYRPQMKMSRCAKTDFVHSNCPLLCGDRPRLLRAHFREWQQKQLRR